MNDKENNMNTVAVLGLGLIGSIYARHLHEAGLLTASWNRTPKPETRNPASSPLEAAEKANVLIIVVSNPAAVESTIESMLPALSPCHLVIQSSTIGPEDSSRFQALVNSTGARYLEAPFTGSKPAAEVKKTIFYLGGDSDTVAMAEPVLSIFSEQRIHCGTGEQACTVKLAMNLQISAQVQALCEALFISRAAGVSDDIFFTCMRGNAAWSGAAALKEPKLRTGDFKPQFSVKHMLKDLRLLDENETGFPILRAMTKVLETASQSGRKDEDFSVIYKNL